MGMSAHVCECQLRALVDKHDLEGLRKAMEGVEICKALSSCHQRLSGRRLNMRHYLRDNESVVERCCMLGYLDMLEMFLLNGCSSNLPTSHGRLLHTVLTCLKAHRQLVDNGMALSAVQLMFELDCDVNIKSYRGKSPLLLASELGDPSIMMEILDRCMPWQLTCSGRENGHTPLHMASMQGNVACVKLLLDRVPRNQLSREMIVDVGDSNNLSPLLCSLLTLKNNVSLHGRHPQGDSNCDARFILMLYSHMAIVELLLHRGAENSRMILQPYAPPQRALFPWLHAQRPRQTQTNPQLTTRSALELALDTANIYEVQSVVICNKLVVANLVEKFSSPYAELTRMLVYNCSINSLSQAEIEPWNKAHSNITTLVHEINDFMIDRDDRHLPQPPSLLSLCRGVIRLEAAKGDKLSQLEILPLPRKLKDYVRFIDI